MRIYSILYYVLGKVIFDKKINLKKCKIYNYAAICAGWALVTLEVIFWSNYNKSIFDGVNLPLGQCLWQSERLAYSLM